MRGFERQAWRIEWVSSAAPVLLAFALGCLQSPADAEGIAYIAYNGMAAPGLRLIGQEPEKGASGQGRFGDETASATGVSAPAESDAAARP